MSVPRYKVYGSSPLPAVVAGRPGLRLRVWLLHLVGSRVSVYQRHHGEDWVRSETLSDDVPADGGYDRVVRHEDGNPRNNDPANLSVMPAKAATGESRR